MELLFLILLFLILYPLLRIVVGVWRQARAIGRQFGGQYAHDGAQASAGGQKESRRGRMSSAESQYVDFEEIPGGRPEAGGDAPEHVEPRIQDAEYEDI